MAKSFEEEHPVKAFGWAARDSSGVLSPFKFSRRATGEKDVRLKILYTGICHSDLHHLKNEWGTSNYPVLPGYICNFLFACCFMCAVVQLLAFETILQS